MNLDDANKKCDLCLAGVLPLDKTALRVLVEATDRLMDLADDVEDARDLYRLQEGVIDLLVDFGVIDEPHP